MECCVATRRKVVSLFRSRLVLLCSLAAIVALGCRAQTPPPNASVDRRIEVLVRSQFNVPSDYDVSLGGKTKSDIPGYDNLPVTFSHNGKQTTVNFLISKDGNTLARLEKFDISKDPQSVYSIDRRPVRGNPDAKVTVVNYDDLECPYCARMHEELFPGTLDHYKGLVKFVYKDYPLIEIHPWAMHASIDANCLADQSSDAYWQFVDYAHSHGQEIGGNREDVRQAFTALDQQARTIGAKFNVNADKLNACIAKQDESAIRASLHEGERLGIDGTPQVFVDGERIAPGAQPTSAVWDAIDRALKADGITPPERTETLPAPQPGTSQTPANPNPSR
jgi:protein-disulfide isomerase